MKFSKSQRSNFILFLIIAALIFTPIGGVMKEYASKFRAMITTIDTEDNPVVLKSYNWTLKGLNTENIDFNDAKGKVVFINFWATWCPPCRAEMPSIQKLFDTYADKLMFVFVTSEQKDVVNRFLEKKNYSLPSYNVRSLTPKEFKVSSIPATYILNKKGEIVVHKVGPADWNSDSLRKLLDELIEK
ncbi:TlpA family protein disulfide reductase [Urechidicola vernalis]|uniref:TlpA disulfide reductase family protein n=1 Tax=Urechidicola vernalis TaxID=3075600 RepID=A0ABU2Y2W3_9FLAO|nr:TlpA disulfide reductase family protein [Urechidicola sp. P050]MDT0552032.1 TlpA disulfide reductase family protein [Urechidicola sp. P050]